MCSEVVNFEWLAGQRCRRLPRISPVSRATRKLIHSPGVQDSSGGFGVGLGMSGSMPAAVMIARPNSSKETTEGSPVAGRVLGGPSSVLVGAMKR